MIIDSHVHISLYENNASSLEEAFDLYLREMVANGISAALIIPDNVENSPNIADLKRATELIGDRPNLFLLGSPQIIQRGSGELDAYSELIKRGRIAGLKFFPGHDPYYPTDGRCLPYYRLCEDLGVPVLFHTGENSGDAECAKWNDPIHIVDVARRYSRLKVIITHYYWPKMDYCYEITKGVDNIYFEIAAMADQDVVEKSGGIASIRSVLMKTIADRPDKVIFGTDWPMCQIKAHISLIKSLGLDSVLEDKVLHQNAEEVYGFKVKNG